MKSFVAALRRLVLPYGVTSGTRIILDGVQGFISMFNSSDVERLRLDSTTTSLIVGDTGTGARLVLDGDTAAMSAYDSSNNEVVAIDATQKFVAVLGSDGSYIYLLLSGTQAYQLLKPPNLAGTTWTPANIVADRAASAPFKPRLFLTSPKQSTATNAAQIVMEGGVASDDTRQIDVYSDTIVLHGDITHESGSGTARLNIPLCKANRTSNLSIPYNTVTTVAFDSDAVDPLGMHDTVTNNSRIVMPYDGMYLVGFNAIMTAATDYTRMYCALKRNGTVFARTDSRPVGATMAAPACDVVGFQYFNAGEYAEVEVLQANSASASRNMIINALESILFWAIYQGPAL